MQSLYWLSLVARVVTAQLLIESSSFGQYDKISSSGQSVPGWRLTGENRVPELLSDRIILTPGGAGGTRGALWTESKVPEPQWIAQTEFRVMGPEKGGGNMQIWYVQEGQMAVGSSSIHTVGKFDGLAVVIDQYGGKGGSIRGFMNDGSIDYKNYHAVDSLAFGSCEYSYRNLGRVSKLQIKQSTNVFEVQIDGKLCFTTDKVSLPKDYYFGITAASAETPDAFEINKFLLFTDPSAPKDSHTQQQQQQQPFGSMPLPPQDAAASQYKSSEAQFEDLHNRLQALSHAQENLLVELSKFGDVAQGRHQETLRNLNYATRLENMHLKLENIESSMRNFESKFAYLQTSLRDSHSNLVESLPRHMTDVLTTNGPRMGLLIFVFVIVQIVLVGVYQVYKRRSKQGPKKYL